MRVSNTPFNSPLNSGHSRTETRQRVEIGSGRIKTGGGSKIDCTNANEKNIRQFKKWYNELKKELLAYNKNNPGFMKGLLYSTDDEGNIRKREDDTTIYKMFGRNYTQFNKNIRTDLCKAANNLAYMRRMLKNNKKYAPAFYEIEYNRLKNNYGIKSALKFKNLNKELVRTITEQREIIDETKSRLPSFKEAWENNKDGVRSRFDTYEDFETEAIAYCKKFPDKCKGGGGTDGSEGGTPGSVSDWRVISDVTEERART